MTGTNYFPGGMGVYSNYSLGFEQGPSVPMTLQWATYYDAADQAGISRIWGGGIHPPVDNLEGRRAGRQVGLDVWALARKYWDGSITKAAPTLVMSRLAGSQCEVRYDTVRGLYYKLQSSRGLNQPFTDEGPGLTRAEQSSYAKTNALTGPPKFYRAVMSLTP